MQALADNVMPIGKHKGKPVVEVIATDPKYIEWLTLQPWFIDTYKPTYNFIVQSAPPSDMSPEHNALQVKFLDDDFCKQVVLASCDIMDRLFKRVQTARSLRDDISKKMDDIRRHEENMRWSKDEERAEKIRQIQEQIAVLRRKQGENKAVMEEHLKDTDVILTIRKQRMEHITDVELDVEMCLVFPDVMVHNGISDTDKRQLTVEKDYDNHTFFIELKPTLGDHYPAVLRQMKDQQSRTRIYYGSYRITSFATAPLPRKGRHLSRSRKSLVRPVSHWCA